MSGAIYNEIDAYAAQWTRNLIAAGHVAPGVVDERSIVDLTPVDVAGPGQRHFFAGIAGWSLALRLAGIPDDADVWTASCPCQPWSAAGRQTGHADERDLWPELFRLIKACRPPLIFGEQVASGSVVGPAVEVEDMSAVRDREAVLGILRECEGQSPLDLHRLREEELAEDEALQSVEDDRVAQAMEELEARLRPGECSQTSGADPWTRVLAELGRHTDASGRRVMRVDGDTLQSGHAALVECAVVGSHQPSARLHVGKHQGRIVGGERDVEQLGADENPRHRRRHQKATSRSFSASVSEARRALDGGTPRAWIDVVRSNLESIGYTVGVAVLPAASVGAPHIRQRLYFVAYADGGEGGLLVQPREPRREGAQARGRGEAVVCGIRRECHRRQDDFGAGPAPGATRRPGDLAHAASVRRDEWIDEREATPGNRTRSADDRGAHGMGDPGSVERRTRLVGQSLGPDDGGTTRGLDDPWRDCAWLPCSDGKSRPVESLPLEVADGLSAVLGSVRAEEVGGTPGRMITHPLIATTRRGNRAARLRGTGNAIVPQQAAAFIRAALMESA